MKSLLLVISLLLLALAIPAAAHTFPAQTSAAARAKINDPNKVHCRWGQGLDRACRTRAAWAALDERERWNAVKMPSFPAEPVAAPQPLMPSAPGRF